MTAREIKETPHAEKSANFWLKEIAHQLALLNEKKQSR